MPRQQSKESLKMLGVGSLPIGRLGNEKAVQKLLKSAIEGADGNQDLIKKLKNTKKITKDLKNARKRIPVKDMKHAVLAKKSSKLYICFSKSKIKTKTINTGKVILFKCASGGDPQLLSKQISQDNAPVETQKTLPKKFRKKLIGDIKGLLRRLKVVYTTLTTNRPAPKSSEMAQLDTELSNIRRLAKQLRKLYLDKDITESRLDTLFSTLRGRLGDTKTVLKTAPVVPEVVEVDDNNDIPVPPQDEGNEDEKQDELIASTTLGDEDSEEDFYSRPETTSTEGEDDEEDFYSKPDETPTSGWGDEDSDEDFYSRPDETTTEGEDEEDSDEDFYYKPEDSDEDSDEDGPAPIDEEDGFDLDDELSDEDSEDSDEDGPDPVDEEDGLDLDDGDSDEDSDEDEPKLPPENRGMTSTEGEDNEEDFYSKPDQPTSTSTDGEDDHEISDEPELPPEKKDVDTRGEGEEDMDDFYDQPEGHPRTGGEDDVVIEDEDVDPLDKLMDEAPPPPQDPVEQPGQAPKPVWNDKLTKKRMRQLASRADGIVTMSREEVEALVQKIETMQESGIGLSEEDGKKLTRWRGRCRGRLIVLRNQEQVRQRNQSGNLVNQVQVVELTRSNIATHLPGLLAGLQQVRAIHSAISNYRMRIDMVGMDPEQSFDQCNVRTAIVGYLNHTGTHTVKESDERAVARHIFDHFEQNH